MTLMEFEYYLKAGIVKKQTPNSERAMSLIAESKSKREYLTVSLHNIPKEHMSPNFVVDYCYDIIMELLRAQMFIHGYNAGNSHEAEVSYTRLLGFSEAETRFLDDMRYFRNGTKYYGTLLDIDYAMKVLEFTNRLYPILLIKVQHK